MSGKKLRRGIRRFDIQFDREEYDALSAVAKSQRLPMTVVVRTALEKYIKDIAKKAKSQ